MLRLLYSVILILTLLASCKDDETEKLPNGIHKAYIECYNTETDTRTDVAGQIEVKNGVVKKILLPNRSIDDLDFWITKGSKSQEVYSTGDDIYTVHLISED